AIGFTEFPPRARSNPVSSGCGGILMTTHSIYKPACGNGVTELRHARLPDGSRRDQTMRPVIDGDGPVNHCVQSELLTYKIRPGACKPLAKVAVVQDLGYSIRQRLDIAHAGQETRLAVKHGIDGPPTGRGNDGGAKILGFQGDIRSSLQLRREE